MFIIFYISSSSEFSLFGWSMTLSMQNGPSYTISFYFSVVTGFDILRLLLLQYTSADAASPSAYLSEMISMTVCSLFTSVFLVGNSNLIGLFFYFYPFVYKLLFNTLPLFTATLAVVRGYDEESTCSLISSLNSLDSTLSRHLIGVFLLMFAAFRPAGFDVNLFFTWLETYC